MKHLFRLVVILLGTTATTTLFAQAAGNYLYNNPTAFSTDHATVQVNVPSGNAVMLKAEVMMNVKATSYTAIFAITQAGKSAREVDSLMNDRIAQIRNGLSFWGIPSEDIHIDAVSVVPTYAWKIDEKKFTKRSTEIPIGFEMKKNIHILFREHALLDPIISEMAMAEVYDMVKIEYNIDGLQTYHEQLRATALDVIHSKEGSYTALKMHLTVTSMGEGFNCSYPQERYENYTAQNTGTSYQAVNNFWNQYTQNVMISGKGHTVHLDDPAKEAMNQQFFVQHAERNRTIFYDRMPYNQFDKVINADTEEPCIQVYYTLQVYYTVLNDEQYQLQEKSKQAQQQPAAQHGHRGRRGHKPRMR